MSFFPFVKIIEETTTWFVSNDRKWDEYYIRLCNKFELLYIFNKLSKIFYFLMLTITRLTKSLYIESQHIFHVLRELTKLWWFQL